MLIDNLKKQIRDQTVDLNLKIFRYEDTTFLCNDYINAIAKIFNLEKIYITSIEEYPYNNKNLLDTGVNSYLYILKTPAFKDDIEVNNNYRNLIIVTKEVKYYDKLVNYITPFPKLEKWHIVEHIKVCCPSITEAQINQIYDSSKGDIYKIQQQIDIVRLFDKEKYPFILDNQINDNFSVFGLTNATLKKDSESIKKYINNLNDINVLSIISLLLKNFRCTLQMQINPKISADKLNISYGQLMALKNNIGIYSIEQLVDIIYFLNGLDKEIKLGSLKLDDSYLAAYIINTILSF